MRRALTVGLAAALAFAAAPLSAAHAVSGATFSGTVTTAADGAPAGNICVTAVKTADSTYGGNTTTADDGTYTLTVPADTYWLKYDDCRGGDLIEQYWQGTTDLRYAAKLTVADGTARNGMDVAMVQGGAISGTITDTAGNPLSGLVSAWPVGANASGGSTNSAADGTYTIHGVSAGTAQVGVWFGDSAGYPSWYYGNARESTDAASVSVTAGATTTGVDVHVPHAATVSGTVKGDDGSPYVDACVGVFYSDQAFGQLQTHTGSDGTYSVPNVAPGPVRVKFTDCSGVTAAQWYSGAADYASATEVDLADGGTASSIDGVVARGLSISGKVVDENNQPVRDAIVDLYDALTGSYTGRGVWTDSAGHYALNGLRGAAYKLLVRPYNGMVARWWPASPTQVAALPLVLTPGVSLDNIDVVVPHGATVSGTIVDEAGQPVKGVCVQPLGGIGDQRPGFAVTDDTGRYTATGLDTGTFAFETYGCDQSTAAWSWLGGTDMRNTATTVNVALGQALDGVDGVAHPGGGISGTVTDTGGNPLNNICVYAEIGGSGGLGSTPEAYTDSAGHYSFTRLWPRSDYVLRFDDCYTGKYVATYLGGIGTATKVPVTAGADSPGNDVALYRAGFLTGSVIDQFGNRVARVNVSAASGNNYSAPVLTDDSGNFRIGGLLPGSYSLSYYDGGAGLFQDPLTGLYSPSNHGVTFDVTEGNTTVVPQAQVTVITTPAAPVSVSAVAGDASAVVSWVAPSDTGHAPVTSYQVRDAGQVVATAGGSSHSVFVPHLANYRRHSLTVDAVNIKGAGEQSSPVSVEPKPAAAITVVRGRGSVVYGAGTTISGRLTAKSTGAALANRVVSLSRRTFATSPWQPVSSIHTTSTGGYAFSIRPLRTTDFRVSYAGTSTLLPASASATISVLPRLTLVRQSKSLVATVVGGRAGQPVELRLLLRRGWQAVSVHPLLRTGRAVFVLKRTGTYRIYVRATSRLAAAWGRRLTVSVL